MFNQSKIYQSDLIVRFVDARRVEHRAIVATLADALEMLDVRHAVTFTIRRGTRIIHAS